MPKGEYHFKMIGSHVMVIAGCVILGYSAKSWGVGIGLYIVLTAIGERIDTSVQRAVRLLAKEFFDR
jgi:hypothetical protein